MLSIIRDNIGIVLLFDDIIIIASFLVINWLYNLVRKENKNEIDAKVAEVRKEILEIKENILGYLEHVDEENRKLKRQIIKLKKQFKK